MSNPLDFCKFGRTVEFYDMECGQVGGGAIEQAQAAIEKAKGYKDE